MDSDTLLRELEHHAARLGISAATLCQRAVLNSHIPERLAAGGSVTMRTLGRIREYAAEAKDKRSSATIVNTKLKAVNKPFG